jgi:hypothetical protein
MHVLFQATHFGEKAADYVAQFAESIRSLFLVEDLADSVKVNIPVVMSDD